MLCKYKDVFGKPNTGLHQYRFLDIAMIDVFCVFLFSFLFSRFFKYNFLYVLIAVFILGVFFHELFCVETTVYKFIHRFL